MTHSLQKACFLLVAAPLSASVVADTVPSVCSELARRANHGELAEFFGDWPREDGTAVNVQLCVDLGSDGEIECIQRSDSWHDPGVVDEAPITSKGFYLFDGRDGFPRYLSSEQDDGWLRRYCEFDLRDGFLIALTHYESLVQAAGFAERWVTAFTQPGTGSAEVLLAHEHRIPETIGLVPAVTWAVVNKRPVALEWLLFHGASVNAEHPSDMPIVRAVWEGDGALAVRLLGLGANPAPLINQLRPLGELQPAHARMLLLAAVRRTGFIPQAVICYALRRDASLLDDLAGTRLKVQLISRDWHAGRPAVPLEIRASLHRDGRLDLLPKVARLYKSGTLPPEDRRAWLTYGFFDDGLLMYRWFNGHLSDEDAVRFGTALCIYFTDADCGPERLQRTARAWATRLLYECPAPDRRVLSRPACNVLMYYTGMRVLYLDGLLISRLTLANIDRVDPYKSMTPEELKQLYLQRRRRR